MNIAVPSRFACLKIEDDDIRPAKESKGKAPKKEEAKQNTKKRSANEKVQGNKPQGVKKDKRAQQQTEKQWEEWQQKDSELVDGNFESDLQNAIMLSKLDYEEKKTLYEKYKKSAEIENKKADGKKKKNKVMTLNQFLASQNMKPPVEEKLEATPSNNLEKGNFFTNVQNDTKLELDKDLVLIQRKERDNKVDENISLAQYQIKLEIEQSANKALRAELEESKQQIQKYKNDIAEIKVRNKQLCAILGQGEMKDKASVLLELQRLTTIKTELTEEVERLHGLLEKERSKNTNNTEHNKHKEKKNKKH